MTTTTTAAPRRRAQATPAPAPKNDAWEIPPIQCYEPEDGVFYAQMGPTGGKHGYPAITGNKITLFSIQLNLGELPILLFNPLL